MFVQSLHHRVGAALPIYSTLDPGNRLLSALPRKRHFRRGRSNVDGAGMPITGDEQSIFYFLFFLIIFVLSSILFYPNKR